MCRAQVFHGVWSVFVCVQHNGLRPCVAGCYSVLYCVTVRATRWAEAVDSKSMIDACTHTHTHTQTKGGFRCFMCNRTSHVCMLWCAAVCVLWCAAVCCSVPTFLGTPLCVAHVVTCEALVAVRCSVLQCAAVCCSVLQCLLSSARHCAWHTSSHLSTCRASFHSAYIIYVRTF